MKYDTVARNEVLRSIDSATFDGTFKLIGAATTTRVRMVKFQNDSDQDVTVSYDGTNAHDIILSGERHIEDLCANKTVSQGMFRPIGTTFYAKGSAGTGYFYVTCIYSEDV